MYWALAILTGLALSLWVSREVYIWHVYMDVPCPFSNSLSCNWTLATKGYRGTLFEWQKMLHEKYGPLVRIGPYHVLTNDPAVYRRVNSVRSNYFKSVWYNVLARFTKGQDNLVSMGGRSNMARHRELHSLLGPSFSGKENTSPTQEEAVDKQIAALINLLATKYVQATPSESFRPCDFSAIGQYFTLDVISSIVWSQPFGFLADADVGSYIHTLDGFLPIRGVIGSLTILPWLKPLIYANLPTPGDEFGIGRLQGMAKRCVEERLLQAAKEAEGKADDHLPRDMLASFMSKGLEGQELLNQVFLSIVAGSDTVGTTLRLAMAFLVVTPAAYHRLCREIADGIISGRVSSPVVRDSECRAMPYLQAVIKETLRLFPVPGELYKEVPPEGDTVEGHWLPPGTWLGVNLGSMMVRPDVWGHDAEIFRPERWLEAAAEDDGGERYRAMIAVWDLGFGAGKSQCLGKPVALFELGKVIVELLRHFDFAAVHPHQPLSVKAFALYLIRDQLLRVTKKEPDWVTRGW
ncbi:Pisatin demethylase 13 [Echria macrotheca]|uniref:Pisatin demethylase 13 n=1 Tax=Echria macrotheca TaxID=438768 RepID=A0AAJ0F3F6_9PEZI|nr:Pisatin demethylase 13 [Echria macrotheca]